MRPSDLDDICPAIGYTATRVIAAWFGGANLHVPLRADEAHPLALLLGMPAFGALVREFGGFDIRVPTADYEWRYYRDRVIAERLACGAQPDQIAVELNLTQRRVEQIRLELVERRWLHYAGGFNGPQRRGPYGGAGLPPPEVVTRGVEITAATQPSAG